jgi:membrane protein DedA with SNARE-associated domain
MGLVIRGLLVLGGIVAEWFIATDSPNFSVMRGIMAVFVLVAIVGVIALWPRRAR